MDFVTVMPLLLQHSVEQLNLPLIPGKYKFRKLPLMIPGDHAGNDSHLQYCLPGVLPTPGVVGKILLLHHLFDNPGMILTKSDIFIHGNLVAVTTLIFNIQGVFNRFYCCMIL